MSKKTPKDISGYVKLRPGLKKIKARHSIRFYFVVIVFLIIAATAAVTVLIFALLGLIPAIRNTLYSSALPMTAAFSLACIIIGTAVSAIISKLVLSRIKNVQDGMREISQGNFSVRVDEKDRKNTISEFGELERTFNQMASDLDGIELFRNDFINNFSHEFKTPIVSIKGFARQLQSDALTEEQKREYIDIIASESDRLANMSANILLLTKLENQQIVSEKTVFRLDEQIRDSIILLERLWDKKNIEFDLDCLEDVSYEFNEEMLSHVWINLITNAINFTPENGKITISLTKDNGCIVCAVSDTGIGMSDETREHIFEKFYQGDRSHHTSGNGIGLNIVKRIITLAGGQIQVESEIDKGSCFTVRLPL
ncbi:MAG: HAMP domain-containing histidine kinase [Ruminococcaceae bacterium]|nr:HAMP domain-containing histidine kinase [Oscillospiraceae bacterium]